jgi:hypothetical protein
MHLDDSEAARPGSDTGTRGDTRMEVQMTVSEAECQMHSSLTESVSGWISLTTNNVTCPWPKRLSPKMILVPGRSGSCRQRNRRLLPKRLLPSHQASPIACWPDTGPPVVARTRAGKGLLGCLAAGTQLCVDLCKTLGVNTGFRACRTGRGVLFMNKGWPEAARPGGY